MENKEKPVNQLPGQIEVEIQIKRQRIPIGQITAVQVRKSVSDEVVQEYVGAIKDGAVFPPVEAFFDGKNYFIGDGDHRLRAHKILGRTEIDANVRIGSERDSLLYAVGANATHGLPRSNADKRKAVHILLNDPTWTQWSDSHIASVCKVSRALVVSVREAHNLQSTGPRKAMRGGKVISMDTSAIGKPEPKEEISITKAEELQSVDVQAIPTIPIKDAIEMVDPVVPAENAQNVLSDPFDIEIQKFNLVLDRRFKAQRSITMTVENRKSLQSLEARLQSLLLRSLGALPDTNAGEF